MQIICKISINNKTYVFVFNKAHFGAYVYKTKHQNSSLKIVEIIRNEDFSFVQTTPFSYALISKSDLSILLYLYFQVSVIFLRLEIVILYTTPYNRIEHSTGYTISAIDSERGY